MKHSRSSSEYEIREAVVAKFRELWPNARIIHEMNVEHGSSRIDVAAVQPDRLWMCEIKSEKDKLDRLAGQIKDFRPTCHKLILAVHEKWTLKPQSVAIPVMRKGVLMHTRYERGPSKLEEATKGLGRCITWEYTAAKTLLVDGAWEFRDAGVPDTSKMLRLLWSEELRNLARRHGVKVTSSTAGYKLIPILARALTGKQIEEGVCGTLRARFFAEADAPISLKPVEPADQLGKGEVGEDGAHGVPARLTLL